MVDRIQLILKVNNLTASRFADEIGVQRSSISHILSGRNQPSLDLIQKILKRFPEISSEWLLNGTGSMMRNNQPDLFNNPEILQENAVSAREMVAETDLKQPQVEAEIIEEQIIDEKAPLAKAVEDEIIETVQDIAREYPKLKELKEEVRQPGPEERSIEKIVIFYSNKTFREYFPE